MTFEKDELLKISIKDFIEGMGIATRKEGNRYFCSSPFSRDSNWSFCIYPTNTYFDFANGHGGNIINLVSRLNNVSLPDAARLLKEGIKYEKYKPNYKKFKTEESRRFQEPFDYKKYINTDPEECKKIQEYAASRRITEGYFCGVFFSRKMEACGEMDRHILSRSKWTRVPALAFLHVDKNLQPCGVKFRKIIEGQPKDQSSRFSARGNLDFYLMHSFMNKQPSVLYIVESESSANSLNSYLDTIGFNAVVVSRGGVSSACKTEDLPEQLQKLPKKLIIDYDGNEELYQQRLRLYKDLDAEPIKLILPKGEDINSLYCKDKMYLIENLIL